MRKSNLRSLQIFCSLAFLYLLFILLFEFPSLSPQTSPSAATAGGGATMSVEESLDEKFSPSRPNRFLKSSSSAPYNRRHLRRSRRSPSLSGLRFAELESANSNFSELHKAAEEAWIASTKLLSELRNRPPIPPSVGTNKTGKETCPSRSRSPAVTSARSS